MVEGPKATEELTWTMQEVSAVQPHKRDQPPIAFHDLQIVPGEARPGRPTPGSAAGTCLPRGTRPSSMHTSAFMATGRCRSATTVGRSPIDRKGSYSWLRLGLLKILGLLTWQGVRE
jgi:hypothetical protein